MASAMGDDEEVQQALDLVRLKIEEKRKTDEGPIQAEPDMDLDDIIELERQAAISEREAGRARERVESAKRARMA